MGPSSPIQAKLELGDPGIMSLCSNNQVIHLTLESHADLA